MPVGDGRDGGGSLKVADYAEALAVLSALDGRPEFPAVRVRGTVTARNSARTIIWGEDPPSGDAVTRCKFYGYSVEAIDRYRYKQKTPGSTATA